MFGNRYDLLGEDDSGDGAVTGPLPVQQAKKEEKPAAKAAPKPAAKPVAKIEAKPERPKSDSRPFGERRPRREERTEEPATTAGSGSPATDRAFRAPRTFNNGERRERRERENDAAAQAGATGARRVYDRRSGTGRGREDKRGGAGRGNWGSLNDEKAAAPSTEEKPEGAAEEGAAEEAAEGAEAEAVPEPVQRELTPEELARIAEREKEEKLMTLDEYLKVKKTVGIALPEARKAGEGEDASQWNKFIAAKSDKDVPEQDSEKSTGKPKEKKAKEGRADAALLRFKSDAVQRRDAERRERSARFREDRPDRPERRAPAAQAPRAAKPAAEAAFVLEADFPALKA